VGPNGSGKSNIVDAIRWCLGEQNPRDLRGQRAEDVIHAGRKRVLGSAEVSLSFEGDATSEPAELCVSRRLHRSGESEYLIDGSRRRLRDVNSALSGLGMDHPRFVVVTQGMTDFLLSATGAERRALLEQAAGLASYRQRRDEASQKLAVAEQNMLTAETVLAELDPRLRSLLRQVRAIEARDDLLARLHRRQTLWYTRQREDLSTELREAAAACAAAEAQRHEAHMRLEEFERVAELSIEREREWQRRVEIASSAVHLAQRELDAASHRVAALERQVADAELSRSAVEGRLHELGGETSSAAERRDRAAAEADSTWSAYEAAEAAAHGAQQRVSRLEEETAAADTSLAAARAEADRVRSERDETAERVRALESDVDAVTARASRLQHRAAEIDGEIEACAEPLRRANAMESDARIRAEHASTMLAAHEDALHLAQSRLRRLRTLFSAVQERLRGTRAAEKRLDRVYEALDRELGSTVLGSLRIEAGAERAIDAAVESWRFGYRPAGVWLEDFVSWRDTHRAVMPPGACWADELVSSTEPLPSLLLGTVVVQDLDQAEALWSTLSGERSHLIGSPPIQIVGRDGSLVSAHGSRRYAGDDRGARYLETRAQRGALDASRRRLERNERRLAVVEERMQKDLKTLLDTGQLLREQVVEARQVLSASEAESRRLAIQLERLRHEANDTSRDLNACREQVDAVNSARAEAEKQLHELASLGDGLELQRSERVRAAARAQADLEAAQRVAAEAAGDASILRKRAEAQRDILRSADAELNRLGREPARLEHQLSSLRDELERKSAELGTARQSVVELAEAAAEREQDLMRVRAGRPAIEDRGSQLRAAREASDRTIALHERAAARVAEVESARARLDDEIEREMGSAALEPIEVPDEPEPSEDEIRRLRARAAQYADFDPGVVQEYRELVQRRDYLTAQVGDLRAASEGVREVMIVADAEMRQRFSVALSSVSDEFNRVFRVMLRGGEAHLEQLEDGGIEVRASLPGKRTRSSTSFSGGERALVASALLFGVLRMRPAPFCVLDEVDAALDETNVDRYLHALDELSERTQTLVVTHNRATMAAATALYGLTMDSDGASSLLSLRLDQYDAAVS
jgi:chromosome segregation protein